LIEFLSPIRNFLQCVIYLSLLQKLMYTIRVVEFWARRLYLRNKTVLKHENEKWNEHEYDEQDLKVFNSLEFSLHSLLEQKRNRIFKFIYCRWEKGGNLTPWTLSFVWFRSRARRKMVTLKQQPQNVGGESLLHPYKYSERIFCLSRKIQIHISNFYANSWPLKLNKVKKC
jgi:hypothetical protein